MKEILLFIGFVIAISPIALIALSGLTYFYMRGGYPQLFTRLYTWNWNKGFIDTESYHSKYKSHEQIALIVWIIALVSYAAIAIFTLRLFESHGIMGIIVVSTTILLLIAPRYIIDLCKALKYNTKTRDSDRLVKLEEEIAKLKNK